MSDIQPLIDMAHKLEQKGIQYSEKNWASYTTGINFGLEDAYKEFMKIFKDPKNFEQIKAHQNRDLSPEDQRRVELMHNAFEPYHLSKELNELDEQIFKLKTKLSKVLNTFRFEIDGKETPGPKIAQILSKSSDQALRKKAYLARNQINRPLVESGFIELLDLRKKYALLYGANDFVDFSLARQELSKNVFTGWTDEVQAKLPDIRSVRSEFAQTYLNQDKLMPWDGGHLMTKIAPMQNHEVNMLNYFAPICELFNKFGLKLAGKNITYDVFPRKNKSEWGYHFRIKSGADSRILASISNEYYNFKVLLHETGHAMHYYSVDPNDLIMNMGISGITSEGFANLFGNMAYEQIFYEQFFGGKLDDVSKQFEDHKKWNQINRISAVSTILFDQALYLENIQTLDDINQLKWQMIKKYSAQQEHEGEPPWAHLIHHTTHPIYLHNYFMGDVTCEMLKQVFCHKNDLDNIHRAPKEFGTFLMNGVIKPSGRYKYEELFSRIAQDEFSLKYLAN
ncbi:MAG: peptidase M3A and M3B thimet/oligopeptidase F [Bacteriovoracaceae bacterium]|nr:peptidase M3A and M3B thimet/oligopeptidase F [Bacteriovoracaceae bacterium]